MIILVDLDGVTADLERSFWDTWAVRFPLAPQLNPEDRRTFYIEEQIGSQWAEGVRRIIHAEGFYENLPLVPGAKEGITALQAQGHNVIFCTSPVTSEYCAPEKIRWVTLHFGSEMATRMIISKDKTLVRGDVLFDDRPYVTGAHTPEWTHVFCTQPYNLSVPLKPRATWATLPTALIAVAEDRSLREY